MLKATSRQAASGGGIGDDIIRRAAAVEGRLSQLAQSLYTAESSPELAFVRSQRDVGGRTGQMASELMRALDEIWMHYPLARDVVQQLGSAVGLARWGEATRLLRPDVIDLPIGARTGAADLLGSLQDQLDQAVVGAARLAERARRAMSSLDTVTADFAAMVDRATAIGADLDVEILEARRRLDRAAAAIAADPTAVVDIAAQLDGAMETVRLRVERLEQQRATLPAALEAAHAQLAEIRGLVARGAEARTEVTEKISDPKGLCPPLDPTALERGDRALQPWLTRIDEQAAAGCWQAAAAGLEQWQRLAARWLDGARHALDANRHPLARRAELRGLLQASQARATAAGRAEEPRLTGLGRAADEALHLAPCDLALAEARVHAYVTALRDGWEGNRP